MIQDAMSAWFRDFQEYIFLRFWMEVRPEGIHDGIEHAVRLHAFLPRSFSRIPEAIATVEDTANIRSQMETNGELVAIAEAVPVVSVAVPEACAVAVIIPAASI